MRENAASQLTENLPKEHVVRAKNQYEQVQTFSTEILDDVHEVNVSVIRLREKLKKNLNTEDRRFGFLKHDINDYFACIPLINDNQFR